MELNTPGCKRRYVIFVPWAPTYGGGVNHVVRGLAAAASKYYDPVIVVTSHKRPQDYEGPWVYLPYLNPWRPLAFLLRSVPAMLRLKKILKGAVAANPHFGDLECLSLLWLRWLRLAPPLIMSVHGADVTEMLATTGWRRKLYRRLFGSADLVVACSSDLAQKLLQLSPRAKTAAIWNATDPPPDVSAHRPIERAYLLCVASFIPKKAHDTLLSAFGRIAEQRPELDLILIGADGSTRAKVEAQIRAQHLESRVQILVNRPNAEVWWWMRHAECFVLPSREEPFGIVLLEAGQSRIPVVATRVGGIPEFVTDQEDALLCDPDRPDQLADAILTTLTERDVARRRVERFYRKSSGFTWQRTFEEYRSAARLP